MNINNNTNNQKKLTFIEAARQTQIVECSIETIASLGFAQASLAQIAKRAGISTGVISYHFKNKETLIRHVIEKVYTSGDSYMRPLIQSATSARNMLSVYLESNIAFMSTHKTYMLALLEIWSGIRPEEGKESFVYNLQEAAIYDLEQILQFGQKNGEFRTFSTRVMAITIRQAIDALPPQIMMNPELNLDSYAKELITLFQLATDKSVTL
ncbi:TetR/AcrR family transcriptional regulator [Lysinibacillus sp. NPDC094403]|uniref:TetR/AcrR family transcriptional regulator n=1 Tax=Lysinibacillus sp. NPDC094403 TaxID=3390581 RepID=UPI003CFCE154